MAIIRAVTSRTSLASNASASGPWFAKVVSLHPSKSARVVPAGDVMRLSNGSLTCQPCLTRGLTNAKTNLCPPADTRLLGRQAHRWPCKIAFDLSVQLCTEPTICGA